MAMMSAGLAQNAWMANAASCSFCASFDISVTTLPVDSSCMELQSRVSRKESSCIELQARGWGEGGGGGGGRRGEGGRSGGSGRGAVSQPAGVVSRNEGKGCIAVGKVKDQRGRRRVASRRVGRGGNGQACLRMIPTTLPVESAIMQVQAHTGSAPHLPHSLLVGRGHTRRVCPSPREPTYHLPPHTHTPVAEAQALAVDGRHERVAHARAHQVQQVVGVVLTQRLEERREEQSNAVAAGRAGVAILADRQPCRAPGPSPPGAVTGRDGDPGLSPGFDRGMVECRYVCEQAST
eukprot:318447-Chlamydomonas_euryale.AAC.3